MFRRNAFGMELHPVNWQADMSEPHDGAIVARCVDA